MTPSDFSILYNDYAPRLTYFAYNILRDREAAHDVVNKVFLKIWESGLEDCHKHKLYKRVQNACIDYLRSQQVRRKYEVTTDEFPDIEEESDRFAIEAECIHAIYEEVKHLPERQREVFIRTYVNGQKDPEIAREMGITVSTVTTQRQNGMDRVRKNCKLLKR